MFRFCFGFLSGHVSLKRFYTQNPWGHSADTGVCEELWLSNCEVNRWQVARTISGVFWHRSNDKWSGNKWRYFSHHSLLTEYSIKTHVKYPLNPEIRQVTMSIHSIPLWLIKNVWNGFAIKMTFTSNCFPSEFLANNCQLKCFGINIV